MGNIRTVIEEFMAALPTRDWDRMLRTLADDVRRVGPEGEEGDALVGKENYVNWTRGLADPLYQYGWKVHRILYSDDGKSALVDSSTRYLTTQDAEPFGYRLVMIFDVNDDDLITNVDLYWKTPKKRLVGDTVSTGAWQPPAAKHVS